ncbi:multidrug efflux SMR transporter [Kocuria sp. CPCC 205268]|uniref:DMT family transporter n=1 Tax=Kocuria oxytropis TaxID=3058913 RepID=UPI0034D4482A
MAPAPGAAQVVATSLLKLTDGFTRLWPTVGSPGMYGVAFALLAQTLRSIPVGVAYALWAGLGTAAMVATGAVVLGEPLTATTVAGIGLVIAGVVVLNLGGAH